MPAVLFLITAEQPHNDNHLRLPAMFRRAGWQVTCAPHQSLSQHHGLVLAAGEPAEQFDVIWPLGFGPSGQFIDRMQMLNQLPQNKLVTAVSALLLLHGKSAWHKFSPESYVSGDCAELAQVVEQNPGIWVLKPNAGSLARQVYLIKSATEVKRIISHATPQYWLLQRYIEQIAQGEVRTLICDTEVLGSYRRLPNAQGIANLSAGASAVPTGLSDTEKSLVAQVHAELLSHGVGFAAIDSAGGYLVETNIANPGGLTTLETLYGIDLGERVVSAISARGRHAPQA